MIAAVYCRKSTEQVGVADEQKSVARQIEHATAYAMRKGWTVDDAHIYVDDGISGAEFDKRPGYVRLLNAVSGRRRAPFDVLVVSELSRLGREQLETGYAVKQLAQAGVRIVAYLDDREVSVDSPIDKFMLAAVNFGAEIERDKHRQRQFDAMARKSRQGHVCGGSCFGYLNVPITTADGRRSHVERQIHEAEATVIRRVFELCAAGHGLKSIAKRLNAEGALSPRAQRGRPRTWAPTSVREVLRRDAYRGVITYNRTRKRDAWGQRRQVARSREEWFSRPAPQLRIVTDELWTAAHARMDAARTLYMRGTAGESFGRPAVGNPSRYLLTNLSSCGICGGPLEVITRTHGKGRKRFYGCSNRHERGTCENRRLVPMADADAIVIEALLDDVIDPAIVTEAVDEALRLLQVDGADARVDRIERELAAVEREHGRLVTAITAGRQVAGILEALQALDDRREGLRTQLEAVCSPQRLQARDVVRVRAELLDLAQSWRQVLRTDPEQARPIVTALLDGRVTFTPQADKTRWEARGTATLSGFFMRETTVGYTSPTGFEPVFWP